MLTLFAPEGIPEIHKGDNLAKIIMSSCALLNHDVIVVTSKIVSKSEGRVVNLPVADQEAFEELVRSQSKRVLRKRGSLLITETNSGFVCANAGIDQSNISEGHAVLLPKNPDLSARRIQKQISVDTSLTVGVIISDTFGRTWRNGVVDVALGCAGIAALVDLRGSRDGHGRLLHATEIAIADEIASAAELVKPKSGRTPVVIVRGLDQKFFRHSSVSKELIRNPSEDLFR